MKRQQALQRENVSVDVGFRTAQESLEPTRMYVGFRFNWKVEAALGSAALIEVSALSEFWHSIHMI